ncbi:unnamed protein product [Ostreobium quekettii]|uniref:Uncharacterized protein n=1 Tax=Ostreobium quekettii TaxID=121088 RepID=A0A8S1IN20_9CHLO|nr:unnamed protein product [Ostreobium quekettii]|eukprot:evm.model.scf_3236.1 EVM.evm.TU.scf_3236.1   scf_3236:480-962(+)
MAGLVVKTVSPDSLGRDVWQGEELVGRVVVEGSGRAMLVVRGNPYEARLEDLRVRKGVKEVLSAVKSKGVLGQLTTEYMGRQYVLTYTAKDWIVKSGVAEVGRLNQRSLNFGERFPLLLQLYFLWYVLETQAEIDLDVRGEKMARQCGCYQMAFGALGAA